MKLLAVPAFGGILFPRVDFPRVPCPFPLAIGRAPTAGAFQFPAPLSGVPIMRSVSDRLNRHFAACAAVAVAATAATTGGAEAAIVYSGIKNIVAPATTDGIYLNLITGETGSIGFEGWQINPWGSTGLRFGVNYPVPDVYYVGNGGNSAGGTAASLTLGSTINFDGVSVSGASSMNSAYLWSYSGSAAASGASGARAARGVPWARPPGGPRRT